MIRNKLKGFFAFLLLLYFAGFAVAPVSVVFPSKQLDQNEGNNALKKQSRQTDIFLFDLALRDALQKVKRSDDAKGRLFVQKKEGSVLNADAKICDSAASNLTALSKFSETYRQQPIDEFSAYAYTRLVYFGLSPPFLS